VEIYKTAALVYAKYSNNDKQPIVEGYVYIDTIAYEGKFWLVSDWLYNTNEGWKKPERIICLEQLPHKKLEPEDDIPADFLLMYPIPIFALDDHNQIPLPTGAIVIDFPDIKETIQKAFIRKFNLLIAHGFI